MAPLEHVGPAGFFFAYLTLTLVAPTFYLVWSSVTADNSAFTLERYTRVLTDPFYLRGFGNSIKLSLLTALEATLVVTLPADAKLKIDDYQTVSTSGTRVFTTPALTPGKDYSYTLKAEVVRDGKTQSAEQIVKVRAGETTPVTLTIGTATSVAGR